VTQPFVVDTDVISETARSSPNDAVVRWLASQSTVALAAVTVYELARGVQLAPAGKRKRFLEEWLGRLLSSPIDVLAFDRETALAAARMGTSAGRRGRTIDAHDLFIAASASVRGLGVATRNVAHFRGLGLAVFDPFTGTYAV
jgi:predicted nucleic acid-binding protein